MNEKEKKILQNKIKVFFDRSLPIHVVLKDGEWLNGYIEEMKADFFMINEFEKGIMPVFFIEIHDVDKFKNRDKEVDKNNESLGNEKEQAKKN
jgi:hypothetical protein